MALGLGLIAACLVGEAAALRIGIDDLDEGYFVQQATRVLQGQVPYRDFETLYTPGLVMLHALVFSALGGPYVLAPRVVALLGRAALAIGVYALARPVARGPIWAAAPSLFLLVALDDAPVRWEPHPGWLSTGFAVLATWCLAHRPATGWLICSGLAAGLAYVFKQNTGAFILAAILVWGARGPASRRRRVLLPLAAFAGITAAWLVPLLVVLDGQITLLGGFVGGVNPAGLASAPEASIAIPVGCLLGGVWLARRAEVNERLGWYLLAGSALSCTQYPRPDTLHLAWSAPVLLVVGAAALDRVRPASASVAIVLGAVLLAWPMPASRIELFRQPLVPISNVRYASSLEVPQDTAAELRDVIADIQLRTRPGEPMFVYPTSPLLYALSEHPNPTRFDHLNPGAATAEEIEGVIADLEAAHVRLVVISDFWQTAWGPPGPNAALEAWLKGRFTDVVRRGAYRVLLASL